MEVAVQDSSEMQCNELELAEIEDLISDNSSELLRSSRRLGPHVTARTRRKAPKKSDSNLNAVSSKSEAITDSSPLNDDSAIELKVNSDINCFLPGTQRVFAKTWGCTHNTSDTEFMMGLLAQAGYQITDSQKDADLWLLNSCTVKDPAEAHFRNEVLEARRSGKYVVVAGCVPQAAPNLSFLSGLSAVGVQQIDRIVEVVEETLRGNTVRLFSYKRTTKEDSDKNGEVKSTRRKAGGASLDMPKIRRNPLIEIIPISTGCLNQCTYCKTRHARGELGSYAPDEIIARAKQALAEGVREIWLTSEDTGAYGRDIETSLSQLLDRLVAVLPKDAMLRVGMTNPPYVMEQIDALVRTLAHPQVYSFMHIPVQSGSDSVLNDMKREYTIAQFRQLCDELRRGVPDITVATDLICAFPTETEADFLETMALIEAYRFPVLFINQFYARAGTPAARMRRECTPREAKRRTREAHDAFMRYNPLADRVGRVYRVLVTDTSFDGRFLVAHNKAYEQVLLSKEEAFLGGWFDVEVSESSKFSMKAKVLRTYPIVRPLPKGYKSEPESGDSQPSTAAFAKVAGGEDHYAETDWRVTANGTSLTGANMSVESSCDCECGTSSTGNCCGDSSCSQAACECTSSCNAPVQPPIRESVASSNLFNLTRFGSSALHMLRASQHRLSALRLPSRNEVKTGVEITWFVLLASAITVRVLLSLRHRN